MLLLSLISSRVADPDPHFFGSGSTENSESLEAQNTAVDDHNGGMEAQNGALEVL
jgi:hypothetical protein